MGNSKFQIGVAIIIIATAVVLGLTKFKLPKKNVNLAVLPTNTQSTTNQTASSTNTTENTNVKKYTNPGQLAPEQIDQKQVRITTKKGEIVFSLDSKQAPLAVSSFVYLNNNHFFDGLTFHRVEPGFVIQGGDPLGNGTGGPGYAFVDEPVTGEYTAGTVAMANSGPDTNGSQFFIVLEDQPSLPKNYTIFGKVTAGMDVVRRIAIGDVMTTVTVEAVK